MPKNYDIIISNLLTALEKVKFDNEIVYLKNAIKERFVIFEHSNIL